MKLELGGRDVEAKELAGRYARGCAVLTFSGDDYRGCITDLYEIEFSCNKLGCDFGYMDDRRAFNLELFEDVEELEEAMNDCLEELQKEHGLKRFSFADMSEVEDKAGRLYLFPVATMLFDMYHGGDFSGAGLKSLLDRWGVEA